MLAVAGLVLLEAAVGAVVLGVLLLGLWRRATALLAALAELGDRLDRLSPAADPAPSGRPWEDLGPPLLIRSDPDGEPPPGLDSGPVEGRRRHGSSGSA